MDQDNIEKVECFRCEACGNFHPKDECEIITIKIVKGKNCKFEKINIFENKKINIEDKKEEIMKPLISEKKEELKYNPADPNVVKLVSKEEKEAYLKRTSSIPPAFIRQFGNVWIEPKDANFETKGAKNIPQ